MPTVALVTNAFAEMGQSTARLEGLAGMPSVAVPHPIDRLTPAEVTKVAAGALQEVLRALTGEARELETMYMTKQWLSAADAVVSCSINR